MSDPTGTNQAAQTGDTIVESAMKGAETAVEAALTADLPFLADPIIKQIFDFVMDELIGAEAKQLALLLTNLIVDVQVNNEESSFQKALAALKAAQATGDANAIQTALQNFLAAAKALGNADGSATPS